MINVMESGESPKKKRGLKKINLTNKVKIKIENFTLFLEIQQVKMAKYPPDERLVYLSCRHIFRDANSLIRKPKLIKQLIEQNKSALEGLIREYNVDTICHVAKILLEGQIFESTLNAKIRFPEVFDVSPAQSADREMSEADAARDEANMVRDLTQKAENVSNLVKPSIQTSVGDKGKAKVDGIVLEKNSLSNWTNYSF
jgi:hypothetical protein